MSKSIEKTIYIYEALLTRVDQGRDRADIPWEDIYADLESRDIEDRTANGIIFSALKSEAGSKVFGMHKPIRSDFLSLIDKTENSITDLLKTSDDGEIFAHSTAFMPIGSEGVISLCRGDTSSPTHVDVQAFLRDAFPSKPGESLDVQNVMSRPRIKEFEEASQVKSFSSRFSTQTHLFNHDFEDDGIFTYGKRLGEAISGDLVIEITVRLEDGSDDEEHRKNLKSLVTDGLRMTGRKDSGARVVIQDDEFEEELRLVAHNMGVKVELPDNVSERRVFTDLMEGLAGAVPAVMEELENSYRE